MNVKARESDVTARDELLHLLRLKGKASAKELAVVLDLTLADAIAQLSQLGADGLVTERPQGRRPGWALTEAGQDRHTDNLASERTPEVVAALGAPYQAFLTKNAQMKHVCAQWHLAEDEFTQFELIEQLTAVSAVVSPALEDAGRTVPRFARYAHRLARALTRASQDSRFVVSPLVDSFHTVWFECHEDFLMLLGISRKQEGSY